MQAEQEQQQLSWKISVHAKSKNFNFRLKATKISPTWKIHRFSLLLKLHRFLLQLKSDSATPPPLPRQQRTNLKSRFLGAVEKLRRPHRAKKQSVKEKSPKLPHPEVKSCINRFKHFAYEKPVRRCSLVVGILAFLFQSIFEKGHRGILILGSVILLCTATLLNKNITEKSKSVLTFSAVAIAAVVCSVVFGFDEFLHYDYAHQAWIAEFVWKAWCFVATFFSSLS